MTNAPQPQLVTVAQGVHAWIGAGGDSNAGAIDTPDGLLVIDAQQYPRLARQFRDALRQATGGKPLRALINTHCHLDHTAGNVVFADLPILAHEKTLSAMEAGLGPRSGDHWTITDFATKLRMLFGQNIMELVPDGDPAQAWFKQRISLPDYDTVTIAPPTQTFADQFTFHPNETVYLDYWGPAHCDGDIVVYLEKSKVIFLGDLLFHGRFPWLGDCDLDGWIDRLARVLTLDIAVVVPGHGVPTDLKEVARFRDMLIALRAAVDQAIREGKSEDAAVREIHLPQYSGINRYQDWMPLDVKAAYRYLRGK